MHQDKQVVREVLTQASAMKEAKVLGFAPKDSVYLHTLKKPYMLDVLAIQSELVQTCEGSTRLDGGLRPGSR